MESLKSLVEMKMLGRGLKMDEFISCCVRIVPRYVLKPDRPYLSWLLTTTITSS